MGRNGGARGAGREQGVGDEQTVHDAQGAQEDRALMRRIAEGDVSAFVTLYHRYRRSMFTYFYRRLADRWGAEDLVQELFMRVLRAADRYDPVQPFAAWLQAMATNLAHDAYRRRATRPEETALTELLEQEQAAAGRAGAGETGDPHDVVVRWLDAERVRHAVRRLPSRYREIVAERVYADRPFGEIAARLGIPEGTARRRMHEALQQLRRTLLGDLGPGNRHNASHQGEARAG